MLDYCCESLVNVCLFSVEVLVSCLLECLIVSLYVCVVSLVCMSSACPSVLPFCRALSVVVCCLSGHLSVDFSLCLPL